MQRNQPVLDLQRLVVLAGETGLHQVRGRLRRDIRHHRDAAVRARRHAGQRRDVVARQLNELRPHRLPLHRNAADIAGRILDADDVLQLVTALHRVDAHVDHRARRDVVDHDRNADGRVDRLEVLEQAFLVRLVVIGRHDQHAVRARLLGVLRQFHRLTRIVGASAGDHGHATARLRYADFHDLAVLVVRQGRAFAGRADGHEPVLAALDDPIDQLAIGVLVHRAVLERRHQRRHRSPEIRSGAHFRVPISRPALPNPRRIRRFLYARTHSLWRARRKGAPPEGGRFRPKRRVWLSFR